MIKLLKRLGHEGGGGGGGGEGEERRRRVTLVTCNELATYPSRLCFRNHSALSCAPPGLRPGKVTMSMLSCTEGVFKTRNGEMMKWHSS